MSGHAELTVWHIPLAVRVPEAEFWSLLDDGERRRGERFLRDQDRRRFVAAHAAMRRILASLTGEPPASLRFVASTNGKPRLADVPLRFNLSHSGDHAVLATSWRYEVGIDIEVAGPACDLDGMADLVMSERERMAFAGLPPDQRGPAFLRLWMRKEAALKAAGYGLMRDPRTVTVGLDPDEARRVAVDGAVWYLHDITPAPGVRGSVCAEENPGPIPIRTGPWLQF
jgi:4'-phosphopantetheinyl transferase